MDTWLPDKRTRKIFSDPAKFLRENHANVHLPPAKEARAGHAGAVLRSIGVIAALSLTAVLWLYYVGNRTATVQAVKQNIVYMNDGTVWDAGESLGFWVVEGDKIRYRYAGSPSAPNECWLKDITRGTFAISERLSSPSPKTSCPHDPNLPFLASR
jgi:hypothetical protein